MRGCKCERLKVLIVDSAALRKLCSRCQATGPKTYSDTYRAPVGRGPYERKATGLTVSIHSHISIILLPISFLSQLSLFPVKLKCHFS